MVYGKVLSQIDDKIRQASSHSLTSTRFTFTAEAGSDVKEQITKDLINNGFEVTPFSPQFKRNNYRLGKEVDLNSQYLPVDLNPLVLL